MNEENSFGSDYNEDDEDDDDDRNDMKLKKVRRSSIRNEEENMENEYEEDLDNLLKLLNANYKLIENVKSIRCTAGSSSGDNYMSVVKRIIVSGLSSENEEISLSFIVKRQIPSLSRRQLYRCDEAFQNEINAYKFIIPMLGEYFNHSLCPKCHFTGQDEHGEIIILEDLREIGYHMQDRLIGLDFEHCKLVMEELAHLHAASITIKYLDKKNFQENCRHIKEIVYCTEADEFYKSVLETSIRETLLSLKSSNDDGSLSEPIKLISNLENKLYDIIKELITKNDIDNQDINEMRRRNDKFVICHGDLWINNIMFERNRLTGYPNSCKFIDLQAMRYASPVFDILHFLYTSTKRDLRDSHLKNFLEIYCTSLKNNLKLNFMKINLNTLNKKLNLTMTLNYLYELYSLKNITNEFYENILYGLAVCMWILPAVTFDPDNIPNLDTISCNSSDLKIPSKELNMTQKLTPEYHSRIKDIALEFYQNGFLNSSYYKTA